MATNRNLLIIFLIGLAIVLCASLYVILPVSIHRAFLQWMMVMIAVGFLCRILRRQFFFGKKHTLHQSISFDAVFQGAITLNPQLPYPAVEQAFIRRQSDLTVNEIQNWFSVRVISAISIPMSMIGWMLYLDHHWIAGLSVWILVLLFIAYAATSVIGTKPINIFSAVLIGIAALFFEGWCWLEAADLIEKGVPHWQIIFLYLVTLTLFEVSPVPLGLGLIELAYFTLVYAFDWNIGLIALPLAYRLVRSLPAVALMMFYLPRYKLSLTDLYQGDLAVALSKAWHPSHLQATNDCSSLLSIVIPAYNEAERLPLYLPKVIAFTKSFHKACEVLVVDDGSTDRTREYVESLKLGNPQLQLLVQPENRGKGAAVRRGVLAAKSEYILFADADGSTPIEEALKLLKAAREGADVVIASRRLGDSLTERGRFRNLLGSAFYRLTNLFAVPGIADTQCGFKMFSKESAHQLFSSLQEDGWAFDVEMLYMAQKLGMTIVEIPVHWTAVAGSKVNVLHDSLKMLKALMRIRKRCKGIGEL